MRTFGIDPDLRWLLVGAVVVVVCLPVVVAVMVADAVRRS